MLLLIVFKEFIMSEQEAQIIAWEELELQDIAEQEAANTNIKWHPTKAQKVTVNGCYTVPVIGTYKPQGYLISGISNSYGPSFLSFVGPWVEGTSELVDVPPPCANWEAVLEAYKSHELLVSLFFTYQHASDWLAMLDKGETPFGGTLSVMKHDKVQGLNISCYSHNHCFSTSNSTNDCDDYVSFKGGLWAIEMLLHSRSEFITSTEVNDEENEYSYTKYSFIDKKYLESLSPQELRKAVSGYLHCSDQYLYHTSAQWQIEMIKAADKGDELALSTAQSLGLFV